MIYVPAHLLQIRNVVVFPDLQLGEVRVIVGVLQSSAPRLMSLPVLLLALAAAVAGLFTHRTRLH